MNKIKIEKNNIVVEDMIDLVNHIKIIKSSEYNSLTETAYVCFDSYNNNEDVEIIPNFLKKIKFDWDIKIECTMKYLIDLINFPNTCEFIRLRCPYILEYINDKNPNLEIKSNIYLSREDTNSEISLKTNKINTIQNMFNDVNKLEILVFITVVKNFYRQDSESLSINSYNHINTILKEYDYLNQLLKNPEPILSTYKIEKQKSSAISRTAIFEVFKFASEPILSTSKFDLYKELPEFKLIDYIANR